MPTGLLIIALVLAAADAVEPEPFPEPFEGTVVEAALGDVLTVVHDAEATKLRLFGIDCPDPGQTFGPEAAEKIMAQTREKEVSVQILTTDSTGLPVAELRLPEGQNLGQLLLKEGLAWWDRENAPKAAAYKKANAAALRAGKGLWAEAVPVAPWDYRRGRQIKGFSYTLDPPEEEKPDGAEEEEPELLSLKGNAEAPDYVPAAAGGKPKSRSNISPEIIKFYDGYDPSGLLGKHMPKVAKDANGNPIGLAVPNISQIPFAPELGFRDGDVIASVNGEPAYNALSRIPELEKRFKNVKRLDVEVVRNGQRVNVPIILP